jgi:PAS domain S-box-containing protein
MAEHDQASAVPTPRGGAAADQGRSWPREERWFQSWFEHMPCGMVVISMAPGRPNLYLAANDGFCRLTGYSWAELTGREFLGDFHPEEQAGLDAAIQQVISGDCPSICAKWRLIRKDGETVCVA